MDVVGDDGEVSTLSYVSSCSRDCSSYMRSCWQSGFELLLPSMSGSLRRFRPKRRFVSTAAIDALRKVSLGGAKLDFIEYSCHDYLAEKVHSGVSEICRQFCTLHEEIAHPSVITNYNSVSMTRFSVPRYSLSQLIPGQPLPQAIVDQLLIQRMHR